METELEHLMRRQPLEQALTTLIKRAQSSGQLSSEYAQRLIGSVKDTFTELHTATFHEDMGR